MNSRYMKDTSAMFTIFFKIFISLLLLFFSQSSHACHAASPLSHFLACSPGNCSESSLSLCAFSRVLEHYHRPWRWMMNGDDALKILIRRARKNYSPPRPLHRSATIYCLFHTKSPWLSNATEPPVDFQRTDSVFHSALLLRQAPLATETPIPPLR